MKQRRISPGSLWAIIVQSIVVVVLTHDGSALAFEAAPDRTSDEKLAFFEKKIRPLFVENCYTPPAVLATAGRLPELASE